MENNFALIDPQNEIASLATIQSWEIEESDGFQELVEIDLI